VSDSALSYRLAAAWYRLPFGIRAGVVGVALCGGTYLWVQSERSSNITPTVPVSTDGTAHAALERKRTEEAEKRLAEATASCTTGLKELLDVARGLVAAGDLNMAAARLNFCEGKTSDPAYVSLVRRIERERKVKAERLARAEKALKRSQGVHIGMSKEDVLASSWGKPQHVNTTTTARGTREQWVYGLRAYLYFDDGVLSAIQN
jgi:hypothetical protein